MLQILKPGQNDSEIHQHASAIKGYNRSQCTTYKTSANRLKTVNRFEDNGTEVNGSRQIPKKNMLSTVSSKDYGLERQRTIKYRPAKTTFREYDKKMINLRQGLKYWNLILENYHEWERLKPRLEL